MELTLTSPALLFPAISLLLVAYTNRFKTISERIRSLHAEYTEKPNNIFVSRHSAHPHPLPEYNLLYLGSRSRSK